LRRLDDEVILTALCQSFGCEGRGLQHPGAARRAELDDTNGSQSPHATTASSDALVHFREVERDAVSI
jgi:hypothetical protein